MDVRFIDKTGARASSVGDVLSRRFLHARIVFDLAVNADCRTTNLMELSRNRKPGFLRAFLKNNPDKSGR